jgi:hypothetical protein
MPAATQHDAIADFNARARAHGWTFVCHRPENFVQAELADVLALWREKAADRPMPSRTDMSARLMKPYLPHMTILERVPADGGARYRVRLHGSALASNAGDNTGRFIDELVGAHLLGSYTGIYDAVLELGAPVRVVSHYQLPRIDYLTGESLVAPLALPDDATPLILSVTYTKPRADLAKA